MVLTVLGVVLLSMSSFGTIENENTGLSSWLYGDFSKNEPLPLSISVMRGFIPASQQKEIDFKAATLWGVDFNFKYSSMLCIGFGIGGFNRVLREDNSDYPYNISYLSARTLYYPNYKAAAMNVYGGLRLVNYIITQKRAKNSVDLINVAINPEIGVLIPVFGHSFVDVSLMYQVFDFDVLTHQDEGARLTHVKDNQWVWALKYYF